MKEDVISSLKLYFSSIILFSGVYPLLILFFAIACAPDQRDGSLIVDNDGTVRGSRLIGQSFTRPEYFWPRPSAVDYNAAGGGGSNLSPADPRISKRASMIIAQYPSLNGHLIPADLVTTSGSGLDPHITLQAAYLQAKRVAAARGIPIKSVEALIDSSWDSPALVALGSEPLVNVLLLNLALDQGAK